jgi:hypothetical protein
VTVRLLPSSTGLLKASTASTITSEFNVASGGITLGLRNTSSATGIPPTVCVVTVSEPTSYPDAIALIIVCPGNVVVVKLTIWNNSPADKVTELGTVPVCGLEDVSSTVTLELGMYGA